MTAQHSSPKNLDIEVLRAYAISITLVAHLGVLHPDWYSWTSYFWLGGGVDLFFAISGFLITATLLKAFSTGQSFRIIAGTFWVRRLFRLWPAALTWSTLTLLLTLGFDVSRTFGPEQAMFESWLYGVLNLQNLHIWSVGNSGGVATPLWHYWSLSLEEQFYLLLPMVLALVTNRKTLIIPVIMIALYQSIQIRPWGTLLWFIRSDALLLGVASALAWHYYADRLSSWFTALGKKTVTVIFVLSLPLPVVLANASWSSFYMGLVAISAGAVVFIASANSNLSEPAGRVQELMIYLGSRSYSIYLIHNPMFALTRELCLHSGLTDLTSTAARLGALALALAMTLLLAECSLRIIENPLRQFGATLSKRLTDKAGVAVTS